MNNGVLIMATTSLSLGEHWEGFIKQQVSSGRYGSASEVVRDALRTMEDQKSKLEALQAHLSEGATQARNGDFIDDFSIESLSRSIDSAH
jgi:antitoxin ParD1/3/4